MVWVRYTERNNMHLKKVTNSDQLGLLNGQMFFPTDFRFLLATNGIRPGCLHGLIGTMGSGKSRLFQKIISQAAEGAKILVLVSEETSEEYSLGLRRYVKSQKVLDNITILEETNMPDEVIRNHDAFLGYIKQAYIDSDAEILFIDNVTTSQLYSEETGFINQTKTSKFLHRLCKSNLKATIFYLAHTGKTVKDNSVYLMVPEDIRGSAQLPIRTEYFYCMQKFTSGNAQYNIIIIRKHRHHDHIGDRYYIAYFDNGKYLKDETIPFDDVNKIFKGRDKLGMK